MASLTSSCLGLHQRVWLMRGGLPAVGDGLIGKQCFNRLACHRDAERGDFDEGQVKIRR